MYEVYGMPGRFLRCSAIFFTFRGPYIASIFLLIYFQQDATLHSLFIYFWKTALHVSGGISTHPQEYTQLYLQYLVFVKPLLLPAAMVEELELV